MGKGDKKTKRGKINSGSFGKLRPKGQKTNNRPEPTKEDQKEEA